MEDKREHKEVVLVDAFSAELIETSKQYAISLHEGTNHQYDEFPYTFHLKMVYE